MGTKEKYFRPEFLQEFNRLKAAARQNKAKHKKLAKKRAKEIAQLMKKEYGVEKVYLYGSLAYGEFKEESDIDLFLVGFMGNYWRALSQAQKIAGPIEVSLACEEDCFPETIQEVYTKGVEI